MLETLFFAFTEDYDFVTRLSQRNIRYIQLQHLSLKNIRMRTSSTCLKTYEVSANHILTDCLQKF